MGTLENLTMDQIFESAGVALNTGHDVYNALTNGLNQFNNCLDPSSRRNDGYPNNMGYTNQTAPIQYGYGYEEHYNPGYASSFMPTFGQSYTMNNITMTNNGYYGFWNPRYGKKGF